MQMELHQIANKQRLQLHHMLPDKKKEEDQKFQGPTNYQVNKTTLILLMFLCPTFPISYWVIQKKQLFSQSLLDYFEMNLTQVRDNYWTQNQNDTKSNIDDFVEAFFLIFHHHFLLQQGILIESNKQRK